MQLSPFLESIIIGALVKKLMPVRIQLECILFL
jgi:hypothetical protein